MQQINIYVGYDAREDSAYQVCRQSILKHSPDANVYSITPIVQDWLRANRVYTRTKDVFASTDFSLTRFLTPYLNNYEGWAVFMDCDFLVTGDLIKSLQRYTKDDTKAVHCVQHGYIPRTQQKMDNKLQTVYPRKNWSSFMLFNCAHPALKNLTPTYVNTAPSADLHQFKWATDDLIGELPRKFNFLVGENGYNPPDHDADAIIAATEKTPLCLHYTLGLEIVGELITANYAKLWWKAYKELK